MFSLVVSIRAGEAIHLTRADTVIFVELEYVPTALKQAEDRIHRRGQKASCLVLHLVAKFDETWSSLQNFDESLIDINGPKMERIGSVLDEDTSNLVASEARSQIAAQILQNMEASLRTLRPRLPPLHNLQWSTKRRYPHRKSHNAKEAGPKSTLIENP
ncbi:MAG: hypothetical protein IPG23_18955 [Burkholderiales bacterium]|nr:hypothetical protein [Burkholderiales bacterium]